MKEVMIVTKELVSNLLIVHRLAMNELINRNKGNLLGVIWLWVNPTIQIVIYGVIFGMGVRGSTPVEGVDFFFWLTVGFIIWNYVSTVITPSSRSIVAKINIVTKMKFPVSIIPLTVVVSELYIHILLLGTVMIILLLSGFSFSISWFAVIYFMFAALCLLLAFAIFNSAITTILRDYQHIVYNIMRTMFFVTPILYPIRSMSGDIMRKIFMLNPFTYLLEGYRDALLFSRITTLTSLKWGVYYWAIVFLIYIIGCILHVRMRKNLLDYA